MVEAFVLVNVEKTTNKKVVFNNLSRLTEVKKAYSVGGNYDFALEVEDTSWNHLKDTLVKSSNICLTN